MSLFFKVAHLPIPRKDLEKSPDISPKQEINEKKYIDVEKPDSEQEQQKHSPIHFLNQLFSEESKSQIDNSFYNLPKLESNIDTLKRNLIEEDHLPNSTPESKELSIENEDLLNERKYIETASGFIKKLKNEEEIESIIIEKNQKEDKDQINKNKEYRKKRKTKYREHKIYRNLWVFFPDDYFKQRWDILILSLLLYSITLLPYRIAFSLESTELSNFDNFVDACFLIDVILNFFASYYDDEGNLIVDRKLIIKNYLTGWFLIDLITSLPLTSFLESQPNLNNFGKLLRLPRFYSLFKMVKVLRLLRISSAIQGKTNLSKYLNRFFKNNGNTDRAFFSILGIIEICHFISCLWYFLAEIEDDPDNWISRQGLSDNSDFELYVTSFYWTIQTVVTVGYGDINPYTYAEHIFAIICMFCGVFIYSITVGSVSATLSRMDKKSAIFNGKMEILNSIQKDYKIGNKLFFKIKNQLKYGKAVESDFKDFVDKLPTNLSLELSIIMNKDIIKTLSFLKNKPQSFVVSFCKHLKPLRVNKGDYICLEGDPADEVFFIRSGAVAIVLPNYEDSEVIRINSSFHFGDLDILFYRGNRMYTYKAIQTCELLVLAKKHFTQLLFHEFKEIGDEFKQAAHSRKRRTYKTVKDAISYYEALARTNESQTFSKIREKKKTLIKLTGIKFGSRNLTRKTEEYSQEDIKKEEFNHIYPEKVENLEENNQILNQDTIIRNNSQNHKNKTEIIKNDLETPKNSKENECIIKILQKMKKWEKKITDLEKFFQKMLVIMNPSFIKSSESNFLKKTSKLTNSKKSVNTKIITQPEKEKRMLIKSVLQKFNSNFQTPKTPK